MKNLKKVLSLVLALAMALSLMTAAFAKDASDFTDYSKVTNKEAVDVMVALGVFDGMNGTEFAPTGTLTREQAAKIITYMVMGKEEADKLVATKAPFADVAASRWSAGAIAYCVSEGIVDGVGNNKFNPTGTLTGQQFAKMLLVALGYDAKIENMIGASWAINASKLAVSAGLTKNLGSLSTNMTREQAAQMAFNAETAVLVDYEGGTNITAPDGTSVVVDAKRYNVTNLTNTGYKTSGNDQLMQFCERYTSKLQLNNGTKDNYGRIANKWSFKGVNIGSYAETAAVTYTAETKESVVKADLKDYNNYNSSTNKIVVTTNGNSAAAAQLDAKAIAALTKNGTTVEIFVSDNAISGIAVINTVFGEVTKVDTKNEQIEITTEAGGTYGATSKKLTTSEGYNTFKKGDKVIVTAYDNSKATLDTSATVTSVVAPKVVTGKATAKNTNDKIIRVDGTNYELSANTSVNLSNFGISTQYDATLYLDAYGYVISAKAGAASTGDKAVAVVDAYQTLNKDGKLVKMVKGVTSNGETVTWEAAGDYSNLKDKVATYSENDGVYTLTAVNKSTGAVADGDTFKVTLSGDITKATKSLSVSTSTDAKTAYFASDVKFIFVKDGKAVVQDGVQKVASSTETYVTLKKDGSTWYITAVYALTTASNSTTTSDGVVLVASAATGDVAVTNKTTNKTETFKTYDAYINGQKVENFYAKSGASVGFYYVEKDNDTGAYILTNNAYTATTGDLAVAVNADFTGYAGNIMTAGGKDYDTSKATIIDATDNGLDTLSSIAEKDASKAVQVSVIYDANTFNAAYVYVTSVAK